jgi:Ca-activated chloride channel family protein
MLEKLADKGNGNYGYIDNRREAEKLLVEQVNGTLLTIAKDVKVQVEFNPEKVGSYRLIGYENRLLKKEDFNNDTIDAGEIGAGHTVTALYEIIPVGATETVAGAAPAVDELKYRSRDAARAKAALGKTKSSAAENEELLTVKIRYKNPAGIFSRKLEFPLTDRGATFASASTDFRFAAAVASFAMILQGSSHKGSATLDDIAGWAGSEASDDPKGYRAEFITLVAAAGRLLR